MSMGCHFFNDYSTCDDWDVPTIKCLYCGEMFKQRYGGQQFCSSEHELLYRKALNETKICAYCGKDFIPNTVRQKYCCADCRTKFLNRQMGSQRQKMLTDTVRKCEFCGKEYTPKLYSQRYCCKDCRLEADRQAKIEARKITQTKECKWCGKEFMPNTKGRKYCSKECAKEAQYIACKEFAIRNKKRKKCEVCGAILIGKHFKYCSQKCREEAERQRKAEAQEIRAKKRRSRKPKLSIGEICKRAAEEHLTYGQYVLKYGL